MQNQRKFVLAQRSAHKETPRASYETNYRETYDTNFPGDLARYGSNTNLPKPRHYVDEKMKYSDLHGRAPSEIGYKSRDQHLRNTIQKRRESGMVSNLKSELQSLKMQVSKLMNKQKDTDSVLSSRAKKLSTRTENDDEFDTESNHSLRGYGKDISDTISVTSEKIIDEPLRRLETKLGSTHYDHTQYLEMEVDLLKTELRNLKNKYNLTKQELKQKCEAMERKNQYLQITLRRSEQQLTECKKSLENEVQIIKFQLSRKTQQQFEEYQLKSEKMLPVRDNISDNELVQEKLNKLYEQLADKNKMINNMNIDLNEVKGILEKKSFELKKEVEKNSELSKQIEFTKREFSRNKTLLEIEISKKGELSKTVELLREKNNDLNQELLLKNEIVVGSEQLESKYANELRNYRQNEEKLNEQIYELQNQLRKIKQLNDSNQTEIKYLKSTIKDFMSQIEQGSKNLRIERENSLTLESNYRKLLDQAKQNGKRQLQMLQQQFDRYKQTQRIVLPGSSQQLSNIEQGQKIASADMHDKDRQVSKWKAQYKLLKMKYEQHFAMQNTKREEIESYYRNFKQYKSKNKILQMRNKVLEQSANDYIARIEKIETENLQERVANLERVNALTLQNEQLQRKLEALEEELSEQKTLIQSETQRANQEQVYRKQIQERVLNIDIEQNDELMQIIEKLKKRISDQDQKINKYIKQMKNKDNLIKQLKKQVRNIMQNQENQLQNFRNKELADCVQEIEARTHSCLQQLKSQSKKEMDMGILNNNELIEQNAHMKGEIAGLGRQIVEMKEQVKNFAHLYNIKVNEYDQMREKSQSEYQALSGRLEEVERIRIQTIKNLQGEIAKKNEQILGMRNEIKNILTSRHSSEEESFDQALKNQIEATKKLREELNKKNDEVYRLRDSYSSLKAEMDNLKSEYDISKLKFISDKKNIQVQFEVEGQNLRSQLSQEQKKVSSLEQKVKLIIDENKKKDTFIQTYIMGKKLPTNQKQLVAAFLKQYEICVTGRDISEKLQSQSQELQKMAAYNFSLMKQIAEMKEKMLLYEAVSLDNSQSHQLYYNDVDSPSKMLMRSQELQKQALQ